MTPDHHPFPQPLRPSGSDLVLADYLKKRGAGHSRDVSRHRQTQHDNRTYHDLQVLDRVIPDVYDPQGGSHPHTRRRTSTASDASQKLNQSQGEMCRRMG